MSLAVSSLPSHVDRPNQLQLPTWVALGTVTLLALVLRLACAGGLIGSDDLRYAKYAAAIADGAYAQTLDEARGVQLVHPAMRFGVLLPVAAVYGTLGISEATTMAVPLVASTLSVLLLMVIGLRLFDVRVALIAGLLYATFPVALQYGAVLVPEPIAECFALVGVLCYLNGQRSGGGWWLAAGAAMALAYLAKEPALFIAFAFGLHLLWERRWRGAVLFTAGAALVGGSELAYYAVRYDDLLFRLHSTQLFDLNAPDNQATINQNLLYRLFVQYPRVMLLPNAEFGLHSILCLAAAAAALALRPRHGYALIVFWAAILWLYLNFGTWSFERYVIMPRAHRYIEFTYPPLMLLTGIVLSRALMARPAVARAAAVLLATVCAVGAASGFAMRGDDAYRKAEMRVLREIVSRTRATPGATIHTAELRWREALDVFDRSIQAAAPWSATFVLVRDPAGLPSLRVVPLD